MRTLVAVHVLLSPGGMIGPGQRVEPEIVDLAVVAAPPDLGSPQPVFSGLVRPTDQRMIAKMSAMMDPADLVPGSVWGDLMAGEGRQLPEVTADLTGWWAEHVGTDAYSGSSRPVLVAHDAHVIRQRLHDHVPLVEELFSDQVDVTSLRVLTDLSDQDRWEPYQWKRAEEAARDAWGTFWAIWRRVNQPAEV